MQMRFQHKHYPIRGLLWSSAQYSVRLMSLLVALGVNPPALSTTINHYLNLKYGLKQNNQHLNHEIPYFVVYYYHITLFIFTFCFKILLNNNMSPCLV